MNRAKTRVPKLRPLELSSHIADLLLVGVGEEDAVRHPFTRATWHLFFFSALLFAAWHVGIRIVVGPTFRDNMHVIAWIRLIESVIYAYLILVLIVLTYTHYLLMLAPQMRYRFVNIVFVFLTSILLFSRLYYSLFGVENTLFKSDDRFNLPTPNFGIHGTRDLAAFGEFLIFSGSTSLNCPCSNVSSNSLLVSAIMLVQTTLGYFFGAVLIATFVQVSSTSPGATKGTPKPPSA